MSIVSLDPIRQAQREWELSQAQLASRRTAYQQARDNGDRMGTVAAAILLAAAYDEERNFYEQYEEFVIEDLAAENAAMRMGRD